MSYLAEATRRERAAELRAPVTRDDSPARDERELPIDSATLSRWCYGAALAVGRRAGIDGCHARKRGATDRLTEVDALAQAVAMRVLIAQDGRTRPRGSARSVLGWIDRAERTPTLAGRDWRAGELVRDRTGREYLEAVAADVLRTREWRDVAEGFKVRERRDRERAAREVVVTTHDPNAPGFLAEAERRDRATDDAPQSVVSDAADKVAEAVADRLAVEFQMSAGERSRVRAALALDGGDSLASVGAREGWTLSTVSARASEGRRALRALLTGRALAEDEDELPVALARYVRDAAEAVGLVRRVRIDAPDLSAAERAAREAVEHWSPVTTYRPAHGRDIPPRTDDGCERPAYGRPAYVLAYIDRQSRAASM